MPFHVHFLRPPKALDTLRSRLDGRVRLTTEAEDPEPGDYQILVAGRPDREHLNASAKLYALIVPWAGVPDETRQLLRAFPDISVHNLHHNAAPTAELACALLLAAAKFLVPFDRALRQNDWTPRYQPNPSPILEGKTALVLGFGAIGQRVGRFCQGLGMQVVGVRRHPDRPILPGLEAEVRPPEVLPEMLPRADALIVTLPYTSETDGLIGADQLALLPEGALLVNVGRGPIVDQGALYHALKPGRLRAAGLDVWYNYPESPEDRGSTPPADYPFHELDNVVMSPHRGGDSAESERLRMTHLAVLLNAAARGEDLPNRVDLSAGY